MTAFTYGELVILISQKGKKWVVRISDEHFSCHLGTIALNELVGCEEGKVITTSKGAKLTVLRPTLCDYIFKLERRTQIIYPKDIGTLLFYGDIQPGHRVLESGVGSGALALALIRAVGDRGMLISVEKRLDFARLARSNINRFFNGEPINHKLIVGNIETIALNVEVDRVVLDLPEPWKAICNVNRYLRRGGILISISPNVGQVQLTHKNLGAHGFANIATFELLKRDWKIGERRARPAERMVAHTVFITLAKKVT